MSNPGDCHWYVVRTKARAESTAATNLRAREIPVFFPRLVAAGPFGRAAGIPAVTEPLFPGYLFVRVGAAEQFARVAWTPGVRSFLAFGEEAPEPVEEAVLDLLRERAGGGEILRPRDPFRAGDRVEIRSGPFSGLLGIIERPVSAQGRVRVLLELLQRRTRVDLRADAVARL